MPAMWLPQITGRLSPLPLTAVYNISSCTETSVNQLADMMAEVTGSKLEKEYLPAREGDIYRSSLDNRAAARGLEWHSRVSLPEGLAATYRSLRQQCSPGKHMDAGR